MGNSPNTYVANAYKKEIWAKVTNNKEKLVYRKIGGEVSGKSGKETVVSVGFQIKEKWEFLNQNPGFSRIMPAKYLSFDITGNDGRVFVSVIVEDELVAENFPVHNDRNIVVTKDGSVQKQHEKKRDVWVGESGACHLKEGTFTPQN